MSKSHEICLQAFSFGDRGNCLPWPKKTRKRPNISIGSGMNRVSMSAARWICEQANGAPPTPFHQAAHTCGNMFCINPLHLVWKTCKENHADRDLHGTTSRGEFHPKAKIINKQAIEIHQLIKEGYKLSEIARRYNVSRDVIADIKRGKTWKWLLNK